MKFFSSIFLSITTIAVMPHSQAFAGAIACYDKITKEFCGFPPCNEGCKPGLPDNGDVIFINGADIGMPGPGQKNDGDIILNCISTKSNYPYETIQLEVPLDEVYVSGGENIVDLPPVWPKENNRVNVLLTRTDNLIAIELNGVDEELWASINLEDMGNRVTGNGIAIKKLNNFSLDCSISFH